MSILLEALRKSEKNQHLRETPTIHTQNESEPVSEPMPKSWLLLLLLVAILVIGWLVWRQYQQPVGNQQPLVAPGVAKVPGGSRPVAAGKPSVKAVSSQSASEPSAGQSRTPVESYQAPQVKKVPQRVTGGPKAADDKELTSEGSAVASRPRPATHTSPKKPVTKMAANRPGGVSKEKFSPGEPEPISYWELPDSVRSDIPEMKFSVLVYAVKPADRFVLINGQRLGEGDSAKPGLVLKEIRRDGVVFSYRLYQFLVKR